MESWGPFQQIKYKALNILNDISHPTTGLDRASGQQDVEAPRISRQWAQEGCKVISPTHRPPLFLSTPRWDIIDTHRPRRSQGHSAAGGIKSMKNYKLYEFDEHRTYKYCKMIGKKSKLCSAANTRRILQLDECLAVYDVFSCMEKFIVYASLFFENRPI
jgi:hypothetical protein